jgi:4-hydroxy-tetrahydrodipicolinate synthase
MKIEPGGKPMARYSSRQAKSWAKENMHGHWTTTITPFLPDGEVDEAGVAKNVEHILRLGTQGIGITWLTGEFWSLTIEERKRVCELTLDSAAGKAFVAVHTSHTSLKECIALTQHAQKAGADFAVLMPPYIIARTFPQVYDFFKRVAAETDLGIIIFNTPQSGMVLKARDVAELSEIPNICGVKVATQNVGDVLDTHKLAGDKIVVSAATDEVLFYQDFYGFRQQVLFANPCDWMFDTPGEINYVKFVEHACRGEMAEASAIYRKKVNPLRQLFRDWMKYLMPKYGGAYPTQMKKAWAELMGLPAGPVRPPLLPLTDEERGRLGRGLIEARRAAGLKPPPVAL